MVYTSAVVNLPISFNNVFQWAVSYQYYNNNIAAVSVQKTMASTSGGPGISVPIKVIAIGI